MGHELLDIHILRSIVDDYGNEICRYLVYGEVPGQLKIKVMTGSRLIIEESLDMAVLCKLEMEG